MTLRSSLATRAGLLIVLVASGSGCLPKLPHGKARTPNTAVPDNYGGQSGAPADSTNSAQVKWSEFFTDPKLTVLIDTALKNNQELNIIAQEIDVAQSEIVARKGEYWPKVSAGVGAGIEKVGKYTSQGAADEANGVPEHLPDFALGFKASWEIDIWGKLRNATKAATMRYLASQEGRKFAITMLVGEIANSYYELMALDATLEVVKQNLDIQTNALEVVKLQKEAAKVTELAVKRFEAEVLKNQSRQFTIQQQIVETEARINFLVGRFPQHVDRDAQRFTELVPPIVHTGVPSQLLENRPDVRQAQLELAAFDLDTQVAKKGFYPGLGISLNLGLQSWQFLSIVSLPASLAYSVAADIAAPLFNRSALTAAYFAANAKQSQAVYRYERAILNGYVEVYKQLSMIQNLEKSYGMKADQVDKLTKAIDISAKLFAAARADYMEVLLTRRDALEAEVELIENKKSQMTAAVSLYQALGGGWR
jgi:NodT family efflux transporter outer membrane factor (OMF) lipoprotein